MKLPLSVRGASAILLATIAITTAHAGAAVPPRQRDFFFTYAAAINGLKAGETARVWLPEPSSNAQQMVQVITREAPAALREEVEPKYGNHLFYLEAPVADDGTVKVSVTYRVQWNEVNSAPSAGERSDDKLFLQPDAKVPVGGRPLKLLEGKTLPADRLQLARLLYDVVDAHMQYRKDKPGWGTGDAVWACDSGFGNCTDFHSLFISLARSNGLPAKFEIGFLLPEKEGAGDIAGYHCWAWCEPGPDRGWIPVDISEANQHPEMTEYNFGNLTPGRVAFSVGRDLILTPKQAGGPLNFFVYPYVEVEGKPVPPEQIKKHFSYREVETSPKSSSGQ